MKVRSGAHRKIATPRSERMVIETGIQVHDGLDPSNRIQPPPSNKIQPHPKSPKPKLKK